MYTALTNPFKTPLPLPLILIYFIQMYVRRKICHGMELKLKFVKVGQDKKRKAI